MADDGTVKRVLAALDAIRSNVPERLDERDVAQYHGELDRLESAGYDVQEWRIPESWFEKQSVKSQSYIDSSRKSYYRPFVYQYRFLTKIDALLGFFQIEGKKVGFEAPAKQAAAVKSEKGSE